MKNPFKRVYEIDPFPIRDRVIFRNGDASEELTVRADDSALVIGLTKAQKRMEGLSDSTPEEDKNAVALYFAGVLFGKEQAEKLMALYDGDALSVITACGQYFQKRLSKIITRAQKHKK